MSEVITGTVAFSNVTKTDVYNGQDTGKYTLTLVLDGESNTKLEELGVRIKDYEGKPQRKFSSKYKPFVTDDEGFPYDREIPYGSTVKVLTAIQGDHPQWGPSTYLNKVKVIEEAERSDDHPDF